MRSFVPALLVTGLLGASAQTPAPTPSTSVSGVVRDGTSRSPIAGARITIVAEGQGAGAATTSGDDGRFVIEKVTPGDYFLVVIKPPYANGFFLESSPVRVDGRPVDGLDLALIPGAVITGRVVDPFGQPAPGTDVKVRRLGSSRLQEIFAGPLGHYQTDDTGRYRFFGLTPGDYLVSAEGLIYAPETRLGSSDGKLISYATVFFPDALDPGQAQVVSVSPGQERAGVDLRLRLTGLISLAGVLTGPAEALARYPSVQLRPFRPDVAEASPSIAWAGMSGSSFSLRSVAPGRYWLTARADPPRPWDSPAEQRDKAPAYWAATEVVVADADISGATLTYQAASSVSGRVVLGATQGGTAVSPNRLQVSLVPMLGTPPVYYESWRAGIPIGAGGDFTIAAAAPGQHQVRVRLAGADLTVVSVTSGGVTTAGATLDVPSGNLKDIVITVTIR